MKHLFAILLAAALLLSLLPACQGPAAQWAPPASASGAEADPSPSPTKAALTAKDVAEAAYRSSGFDSSADVEYLTAGEGGEDYLAAYLENAYALEMPWEDAAVIRATGASAFEVAALRLADEDSAVRAAIALHNYMTARQGDFAGYAPAEADMVANGSFRQTGPWLGLFICPDPKGAEAGFEAAVNGRTPAGSVISGNESVESAEPVESAKPVDDVDELLALLVEDCSSSDDVSDLEWLDGSDPDVLTAYITDVYGLRREQWTEAAIAKGKDGSVFEIAVLRMAEEQDIWELVKSLAIDYLDVKEEEHAAFPAQAELLSKAIAGSPDDTDLLIIAVCGKPDETMEVALRLLGTGVYTSFSRNLPAFLPPERTKFVPPHTDDMTLYDTVAIRAAWEQGDPSPLSAYDRKIYDEAQKVLNKALKGGMSDYEKEKAIYSWVVNNVNYDWTHQDVMRETPRESFTPYGGLVNHTAVCLGYATTFQLLCDLAGVECITVVGAAFQSREDHGWNMVRLNGNWYCMDVTWDANYREQGVSRGREQDWVFFNVTSDRMATSDHQWDYANTPEATAEDQGKG